MDESATKDKETIAAKPEKGEKGEKVKWTSAMVVDLLRARYVDKQRFCFMEQVPSGTGRNCYSWVDAAVCCLWPSDGLVRLSFEVKVSRSDFLNEIRSPLKNEFARKYFHAFSYVAPSGVVKDSREVPEGCGWIEAQRGRLVTKLEAPRKTKPEIDEVMLAALMRSASNADAKNDKAFERKVLQESVDYKIATAYREGAKRFLDERRAYVDNKSPGVKGQDVYEALLRAATQDNESERMDRAVSAVSAMQRKLLDAWDALTVAAVVPLLSVDKDVEQLLDWYGGDKKRIARFYKNNGDDVGRATSLERLAERARAILAQRPTSVPPA